MPRTPVRTMNLRTVADRSGEIATQVGTAVQRSYRNWSSPGAALRRKVRAAQRRRTLWTGGAIVSGGYGGWQIAGLFDGAVTSFEVLIGLLMFALFLRCVVGVVRACLDLRDRRRQVAALPPPAPARVAVAAGIRSEMERLDGYSDGLRRLVTMVGIDPAVAGTVELRTDILTAADGAETHLRDLAARYTELSAVIAAAPPEAAVALTSTAQVLRQQLAAGVAGYGDLVTAAGETVHATHVLDARSTGTAEVTERLQALAWGMRELGGSGNRA